MNFHNKIFYSLIRSKNPITFYAINYFGSKYFFKNFYNYNDLPLYKEGLVTISFDCDFDSDYTEIEIILNELDKYQYKASFAVIGKFIEKYPEIHQLIIDRGHTLLNHTYTHPDNPIWNPNEHFHKLPYRLQKMEIERCHEVCFKILKYEMNGFRIPHFGRQYTNIIYEILDELNYKYSSSIKSVRSRNSWQPYIEKEKIVEFPLSTCPKHPLFAFDSYHSIREGKHSKNGEFKELFYQLIRTANKNNIYINVYFDPRDFFGNNINYLRSILKFINMSNVNCINYPDLVPQILN